MISPKKMNYLRHTTGEDIVRQYGGFSKGQFRHDGLPVVIAARNEENDLPATLLALADSRWAVRPIVAENGSSDRTERFARAMGATVLTGAVHKMDALQQGVRHVVERKMGRSVLFLDADTLVGPNWAESISPGGYSAGEPHIRFGSVVYAHGETPVVDAARTAYALAKDVTRFVARKAPVGRGASMSIYFPERGDFYDEYLQLPPDLFVGEEENLAELARKHGGKVSRALGPRAIAITRGDRYDSLLTLWRLTGKKGFKARVAQYTQDYGEFTPNERS